MMMMHRALHHNGRRLISWRGHYLQSRTFSSTDRRKNSEKNVLETDVVVVGGGPTGLLLSNLLSKYGTSHILLESKSEELCYGHPQAHYINLRSMEILRHHFYDGIYKPILANMRPCEEWEYFRFSTSVLGRQV